MSELVVDGRFTEGYDRFVSAGGVFRDGGDIPRTSVTVGGYRDAVVGTHGLGAKLILHEEFTGEMEQG